MTTLLALMDTVTHVPAMPIEVDIGKAADYARQDKAESTRQAYRSDFRIFTSWCASRGVSPLPAAAETVAGFLAAQAEAGLAASTISRRGAAIRHAHKLAGHEPPTNSEAVKATLRGIRRSVGTAPKNRKAPAIAEVMHRISRTTGLRIKDIRDRALLLLGFAAALRRSEIVALDVSDIEFVEDGLRITIRRSKTDQEAAGQTIAVIRGGTHCPVKALREWLDVAQITEGPVFRGIRKGGKITDRRLSGKSVRIIMKDATSRAGFNSRDYSAHSLRSGAATTAAKRGAPIHKMQQLTRHKSVDVLLGYIRDASLFDDHCLAGAL
jgi:site-specific recombinase XerD